MIDNNRIVIVIPAGRRRYMEVLIPQILRESCWDELQIWLNTDVPEDIAYLSGLPELDKRIRLVNLPQGVSPHKFKTIFHFFTGCTDPRTVYIRLDDDVCYIEPGGLERLARFRIENVYPFLVFPIIINNAIVSHVLQALRRIRCERYLRADSEDRYGWKDPLFAEGLHRQFLGAVEAGNIEHFRFDDRMIALSRMSINCIAWRGEEFAQFEGKLPTYDEEEWLSVIRPTQIGRPNMIYSGMIVSHFAFFPQREHLDRTDILERYRAVTGID